MDVAVKRERIRNGDCAESDDELARGEERENRNSIESRKEETDNMRDGVACKAEVLACIVSSCQKPSQTDDDTKRAHA